MAKGIGIPTAFGLLIASVAGALNPVPAAAEPKCTTKTYVCLDSRQGARLCITTVCTDDKGDIVSTDTIVLKEGEQSGPGPRSKVRVRDMNVAKPLGAAPSN